MYGAHMLTRADATLVGEIDHPTHATIPKTVLLREPRGPYLKCLSRSTRVLFGSKSVNHRMAADARKSLLQG
ncbi:hypothetical protein FHS44_004864 [Streptosporangium saharense]|uniref:Uncharacterized protein n=1 Tax=Streptosporangium saharense TaxID=1706840 RepID=A0A7W7VPP8_9ACTN|nr:hypothetical protein [Streptosporangium saharense]